MRRHRAEVFFLLAVTAIAAAGCRSPYRSDQGALFGGLVGAGTGALIGDAVGNTGAGAVIGAGVGALTGAAVGQELDNIEAANRAAIEQQLGRQLAAGAVRVDDVLAMTQAGVDEELIVSHVQSHGTAGPLQTEDVIFLSQQGVSTRVIKAMQAPPRPPARAVSYQTVAPRPVIVEEHHYGPPVVWGPPSHCYHPRRPVHRHRPGVSWGISVGH